MKIVCFQDPISISDYHASFQNCSVIDLLLVWWFMCEGRAHFQEQFLPVFLGGFPKMAIKSWIIGLDSYTIPHFNANNMSWRVALSKHPLGHKLQGPRLWQHSSWSICKWRPHSHWKNCLSCSSYCGTVMSCLRVSRIPPSHLFAKIEATGKSVNHRRTSLLAISLQLQERS